jgi:serine/threonine protein kinase/pSer/pThr/pTyr-binding forkhead associated (FHA) protein
MLGAGALLQNRYRVVRLVERTPASIVYEATDERFGAPVALKEWEPGGADASRNAFAREAMLLNRLFHPAFVHVFDTFAEAGSLYVVEQEVGGATLAEKLERDGPVSPADALAWADRILDALDMLHTLQPAIVHANVQPSSIRVTPRGDALLVDFGLCVEAGARPIGAAEDYAPYEQLQGDEIDGRADVYGLCATLYHALCGEPPPNAFERWTDRVEGRPAMLSALDHVDGVEPHVAAAVERGLAIEPADRFASAAELRAALRMSSGEHATDRVGPSRAPTIATLADEVPIEVAPTTPDAPTARVLVDTNAPTVALDPRTAIDEITANVPAVKASSTSLICRTCGASNDALRLFCPYCGSLLRADRRPGEEAASESEEPPTVALSEDAVPRETPPPPKPLLAQLLVLEGEEPGKVLPLGGAETEFGRAEGDHTFPLDIFMSGRHAQIVRLGRRYGIRDVGSRNGTFLKIRGEAPLRPGDVILAGTQLLRFDPDEASGRAYLRVLLPTGAVGRSFELDSDETEIGRNRGDITFPDDHSVAETHARVIRRDGKFFVADCGTKNGTFLRLKSEALLVDGDIVILGKHIFRFEISEWEDDYSTLKGF